MTDGKQTDRLPFRNQRKQIAKWDSYVRAPPKKPPVDFRNWSPSKIQSKCAFYSNIQLAISDISTWGRKKKICAAFFIEHTTLKKIAPIKINFVRRRPSKKTNWFTNMAVMVMWCKLNAFSWLSRKSDCIRLESIFLWMNFWTN